MPFSFLGSLADLAYNELNYHRERDYNELNYRRSLENQEKLWAREDTAVQRRVADLEAAGLNPLLAVGSAASSGLTSVHAGSISSRSSNFGANLGELNDFLKSNYDAIKEQQEIAVENSKADLANKEATKDLLESQKTESDMKALKAIAETENLNQKTRESAYNLEKYESMNIPTNTTPAAKTVTAIRAVYDDFTKNMYEAINNKQRLEEKAQRKAERKARREQLRNKIKNFIEKNSMKSKEFEDFLKSQYD